MGYKILFLAWCNDGKHDKVWGFIGIDDDKTNELNYYWGVDYQLLRYSKLYSFWGRRGKTLQWKCYSGDFTLLTQKKDEKLRKGYHEVRADDIERITPGFTEELENNLVLARLTFGFD